MSTEAEKRAVANYQKTRDAIMLRPTKEEGQMIRTAAANAGMSVQAYVLEAVRDRMKRDAAAEPSSHGDLTAQAY